MPQLLTPLLERMARSGVAQPGELRGCSPAEIASLETVYDLSLPAAYREYLATMGHAAGRLFTHDHLAVTYDHVRTMTAELRHEFRRKAALRFLGPGAFVIAGRLGEDFEFIRCPSRTAALDVLSTPPRQPFVDTVVLYLNTVDRKVLTSHPSVLAWLDSWCAEAESAIADGYFLTHPEGTTP